MNVHLRDRLLRIGLGVTMLSIGWLVDAGAWAFALRVFGFFPLITGLVGWCPVYALLRIGKTHSR
ncbi:MAG: DUF2892 domain-containing protein [bacterium]|nr:DUF2892 domain-containing protein [bacterium]